MRLYLVTSIHLHDGEVERAWFGSRSQAEEAVRKLQAEERHLHADIAQIVIPKSKGSILELLNGYA